MVRKDAIPVILALMGEATMKEDEFRGIGVNGSLQRHGEMRFLYVSGVGNLIQR
ncbi:MAG: hypothetical protein J7647_11770 [Cyanobacteria bacterium SBLK]|nr:hypothetical protein [Cyanobacteria bacterium SBLK]